MKETHLIIFDMDGVLVDVGLSYREVVRTTVFLYLRDVAGIGVDDDSFITRRDVSVIKKQGGLNNDWDLTSCILELILRHRSELGEMPLSELYEQDLGQQDRGERGRYKLPPVHDRGDVTTGNLVKRIFQEVYLGRELFEKTYEEDPQYYVGQGYIEREKLIPEEKHLEHLAERYTLGIATGRPRAEAEYALVHFEIARFFPVVVSEDDIAGEEARRGERLRKPHPYSLLRCAERAGFAATTVAEGSVTTRPDASDTATSGPDAADVLGMYVGDMPDDMITAARAGMLPVGFVNDRGGETAGEQKEHRRILERNGAYRVVGNFDELIELVGGIWACGE
jgi:phosphoglycolate phosphatase-like HAD superfamily hydrolase